MKRQMVFLGTVFIFLNLLNISCQKEALNGQNIKTQDDVLNSSRENAQGVPPFDLNVLMRGAEPIEDNFKEGKEAPSGKIKFRQDPDPAHIISLETSIRHLIPNHEYILQRAVDVVVDGNCTGTNWLTLGLGLAPKSILTDDHGNGEADLWRDVSAIVPGTSFDIHFQVLDAGTLAIVMTSDCYQYTVR